MGTNYYWFREKIDTENAKLIDEISDEEYEKYHENLEKTLESSEVYTKFITVLLETENE